MSEEEKQINGTPEERAGDSLNGSGQQAPMGKIILEAKANFMMAILQIQNGYGLSPYLTDILVTSCLADIRDCVNKDLVMASPK